MAPRINTFSVAGLLLALLLAFVSLDVQAQRMPERSLVRKGNRQYNRGNWQNSIERYEQALQRDSSLFETRYNLGNALSRAERYETAEKMLLSAAMDTSRSDEERAEAFFNLGDVQFRQQNLKGALESFKNSLRLNPSDMEAKYNYAYVKKLLEQQEQNQDQNDQNDQNQNQDQNRNKDQNKDNQNDQNGDNKDQNDRNQDRNQGQNDQNDDNRSDDGNGDNNNDGQNDEREQPSGGDNRDGQGDSRQQAGIPSEQAEAMLDAIQAQEDKTQEKVKERQGVIIRGKKNW